MNNIRRLMFCMLIIGNGTMMHGMRVATRLLMQSKCVMRCNVPGMRKVVAGAITAGSICAIAVPKTPPIPLTKEQQQKYKIPDYLRTILDAHAREVDEWCFKEVPWLPGYIVKDTDVLLRRDVWSRIKGHALCDKLIKENPTRFSLLEVPAKYYWINPLNGQVFVIAEKVDGSIGPGTIMNMDGSMWRPYQYGDPQFNIQQTQQLCDFILEAGWDDSKRDDLAIRSNGKVGILDLDSGRFDPENSGFYSDNDYYSSAKKRNGCRGIKLLKGYCEFFDPKARAYVEQFYIQHCTKK